MPRKTQQQEQIPPTPISTTAEGSGIRISFKKKADMNNPGGYATGQSNRNQSQEVQDMLSLQVMDQGYSSPESPNPHQEKAMDNAMTSPGDAEGEYPLGPLLQNESDVPPQTQTTRTPHHDLQQQALNHVFGGHPDSFRAATLGLLQRTDVPNRWRISCLQSLAAFAPHVLALEYLDKAQWIIQQCQLVRDFAYSTPEKFQQLRQVNAEMVWEVNELFRMSMKQ